MANFGELEAEFLARFGPLLELNRPGCTTGQPQGLHPLDRDSFVNTWTPEMENDFEVLDIPNAYWAYGGMLYLPEGLVKNIIKDAREQIRKQTEAEWTWDDYKAAVVETLDSIALLKRIGTGVAIGVTLGPSIIVGGLGLLGFGAAGVGAGSVAVSIVQSIVYRGATGGLFSVLQSVGATGVVGAAGTAVAGVAGGTVGAAVNFLSRRR